jgi:hypothetical protein
MNLRREPWMKCRNCSAEITHADGDIITCEFCGSRFHRSEVDPSWRPPQQGPAVVKEIHHYYVQEKADKLSSGLGCLCFLFFPLGWILYFLYKDSSPKKAKAALVIAVIMTVTMFIGIASGDR